MPKTSLRSHLFRLAMQDDEIRPALVQLLKDHGGLSQQEAQVLSGVGEGLPEQPVVQQPVVQQPVVQQPVVQQPVVQQPVVQQPSMPHQPIIIQQPTVVQQAPAATLPVFMPALPGLPGSGGPPPALGALLVTERTRQGFEHDLRPEMDRLLASGKHRFQVAAEIMSMIEDAFQQKDLLYNILIRHQSTFESDAVYRESLERLVQAWVADTVESGG